MAQFTVRNLEDDVRDKLRERAVQSGQSFEETVRQILRAAVVGQTDSPQALGTRISGRFSDCGLTEPIQELRGQSAKPADFS